MREKLQFFNFSVLVTKLDIAFKIPESYGGDLREIYDSIAIVARSIGIEVPSWGDLEKSPKEALEEIRSKTILAYPDMGDFLNLGKIMAILMAIGFKDKRDSWEPIRTEQKDEISRILLNKNVPKEKLDAWLSDCNTDITKEDCINSFIQLLEYTDKKESKKSTIVITNRDGTVIIGNESSYSNNSIKITDHSIKITIGDLIKKIDDSQLPSDEKSDLKQKIYEILKHPLVSAIIGASTGSILG